MNPEQRYLARETREGQQYWRVKQRIRKVELELSA